MTTDTDPCDDCGAPLADASAMSRDDWGVTVRVCPSCYPHAAPPLPPGVDEAALGELLRATLRPTPRTPRADWRKGF